MYCQAGKHHQNDPKFGELHYFSNQAGQADVDVGALIQKLHKVFKIAGDARATINRDMSLSFLFACVFSLALITNAWVLK